MVLSTDLLLVLAITLGLPLVGWLLWWVLKGRPISAPAGEAPAAPPVLRSRGGTPLRSRGELLIANYLEAHGIPYEYEPKVCGYTPDFFLREKGVIIEYWGLIGRRSYDARMQKKVARYKQEGYRVIGLTPRHVQRLDQTLGRKLKRCFPEAFRDLPDS